MSISSKSIFLPGLNGIRSIAALAVIFSHINLNLNHYGLSKKSGLDLANFGVTIFFALSGFLITFLLLKEKDVTHTISIKKFYMRRLLRIWPLYFLYIFLVVLVIGVDQLNRSFAFYLLMMPNIPFAINAVGGLLKTIPYLSHYWSLGVEEQFYAFWPWTIKKIKNLRLFLILFIVGFLLTKILLKFSSAPMEIQSLLHYTRFGCLAIGGLGAWYYLNGKNKLQFLNYRFFEISSWAIIGILALGKFHIFSIIDHEIIAIVTVVLIINQISNNNKLINLENKVFDFLGKISYGLYVYNPLIIYLLSLAMLPMLQKFKFSPIINTGLVFAVNIATIIIASAVSYYYFEKPFLRIKDRFTTIKSSASRPEANKN